MWCELCVVIVSGLVLLVAYIRWSQAYWRRRGIPSIPPMFLLGNFGDMLIRKKALPYIIQDLYKTFKDKGCKFGGVYQLLLPMIMVTDPEIIHEITVKHFDHFVDRKPLATEKSDELLSRSLLVIGGENWRMMRHALSPAYTGSKLRNMTELMRETGQQMVKYLTTKTNTELNIRELFRRFTADVIATTAYGTVFDSVNDPNNEFFKHANKVLDLKGLRGLVLAGYIISPKLMEILKIPLIPTKMKEYFLNIICGSIKYREERNMTRPDMIQLLLEAKKEQLANNKDENKDSLFITDLDIVSQAVTIFLGGFESVSTTLSFCALEIAAHPDIQERLRTELDATLSKSSGEINYDILLELKYMDMVLSEVLRMYPAIPMTDRKCTKSFEMPELGLKIEVGTIISLPIYALHHDPDYFPDPERFDPERFNKENKHKIQAFTNIPFGAGPRNCIGMRLSFLQMKLCLAYLLSTSVLDICSRTPLPVRLSPLAPLIAPEGDFWLAVTPREQPSIKLE